MKTKQEQLDRVNGLINWDNWQDDDTGKLYPITGVIWTRLEWMSEYVGPYTHIEAIGAFFSGNERTQYTRGELSPVLAIVQEIDLCLDPTSTAEEHRDTLTLIEAYCDYLVAE